jgi:hypothetical protein
MPNGVSLSLSSLLFDLIYFPSFKRYTACRPDLVDLTNCGIASTGDSTASLLRANPHADPTPLDLLKPVLRGVYCWGLEHALVPDSLVLVRKVGASAWDVNKSASARERELVAEFAECLQLYFCLSKLCILGNASSYFID